MKIKRLIEGDATPHYITSALLMHERTGQAAGALELMSISLADAIQFCQERNFDLDREIPNFEQNFQEAQRIVSQGRTQRSDMPVINDNDVKDFQRRLEKGKIDIEAPYADSTNPSNPFPEGLHGEEAEKFLKRGLKKHDGEKDDDKVDVRKRKVTARDLKPIQRQIYFDKSMGSIIEFGVDGTESFVTQKSFFIVSSDNYIIDGHHRFLASMLVDPSLSVNCMSIDLDIKTLLPLARAYGDAIGNPRNQ